jgi:hypothetical protein
VTSEIACLAKVLGETVAGTLVARPISAPLTATVTMNPDLSDILHWLTLTTSAEKNKCF